jgi:hypothetical protein
MWWKCSSGACRVASLLTLGSLLGAATVVTVTVASGNPALAACSSGHWNTQAYDGLEGSGSAYGNHAIIFVNSSSTISSQQDSIFRSLFIYGPGTDDVEVGWTAKNGGYNNPVVYAEWINRGADSGPQFYTGYSLHTSTNYWFTVENVGSVNIWRFYVDGQSSPFKYSPTMAFAYGLPVTNSERYNSCDSLWTNMYEIGYYERPTWIEYLSLKCYYNNAWPSWQLLLPSNSQLFVEQASGVC